MDVPLAEDREFAMLEPDQISVLNAVERMGATLSLFGILMIFVTFAFLQRLRTIPNTFIFFASIANIGACVACLIGYDGISALHKDIDSPLCQAQGFIFEWFMQSDPWWSFAMAINVYMVFFMSFNPTTFRHYLWAYCLVCYGLPAIPAFVFLLIHVENGPIYGDAVLWCWIGSQWNALRIYSYYLPIWICSVLSAVIYFAVGYHVFHQRNQLRNLSLSTQGKDLTGDSTDVRDSAEKNLTSHAGPHYYGSVTTEIQVTSAAIPTPLPAYTNPFETSPKTTYSSSARCPSETPPTLRISTHTHNAAAAAPPPPRSTATSTSTPSALSPMHTHNYPWSREPTALPDTTAIPRSDSAALAHSAASPFSSPFSPTVPASQPRSNFENTLHSFNATQYTSITADPSAAPSSRPDDREPSPTRRPTASSRPSHMSGDAAAAADQGAPPAHRHRPHHHQQHSKRGSDETATSSGGAHSGRSGSGGNGSGGNIFRRMSSGTRRFGARLKHMDPVKLAYLRTSFVFAISILVTWTPSSINRVYTLIYPDKASYGLNIAAAVVLPLQGVWNAVIYFTTSWKIFREEMEATRAGRRVLRALRLGRPSEERNGGGGGGVDGGGRGLRQSGGSFALGSSSVRTPRSEMGRNRRLEGESRDGEGVEGVELQSPLSSPRQPPSIARMSTMRVTQKQLDDFA